MTNIIRIEQSVYEGNEKRAREIRDRLTRRGIHAYNILGGAGSGKTTLLSRVLERLDGPKAVIEGDLESDIDTRALEKLGVKTWQINTGGTCHLNASMIEAILGRMEIPEGTSLFIENIGNLVCPAEFVIGEHVKMLVCSVPEGSDKPYKYPYAFAKTGAVVLTKTDLLPYIDFDRDFFTTGLRAVNPEAPLFEVCAKSGEGIGPLVDWIRSRPVRIA